MAAGDGAERTSVSVGGATGLQVIRWLAGTKIHAGSETAGEAASLTGYEHEETDLRPGLGSASEGGKADHN